jgi:hypothetical protein
MIEALVALGIVLAILLIIFLFNPPEAWIKRAFRIGTSHKPKDPPLPPGK